MFDFFKNHYPKFWSHKIILKKGSRNIFFLILLKKVFDVNSLKLR